MDSSNNHHPWKNDATFQYFVYEYMIKRGMHKSAEIFMNEANVPETHPTDLQFMDSMFDDDSPEGFLHEWWSVFYDVPRMTDTSTNISSFRTPQMSMIEQRSQQFQASSSSTNMMPQTTSRLMPQRLHNNNPIGNLADNIDPSLVALINENDQNFF
ncbi:hypothetical protein TSUD_390630 [Trifolium subterraneum]|uniref:Uncharacterized protein n=1 Tax=Trifolium subterraneum TaxID=3900 RepID=A0A2Z6NCG9_TRISU|nr:hypothetical protein TSUD_390630 [Trifolium subterraneum]